MAPSSIRPNMGHPSRYKGKARAAELRLAGVQAESSPGADVSRKEQDPSHQPGGNRGPVPSKVRAALSWLRRDPIVSTVIGGLILAAILAWIGLG